MSVRGKVHGHVKTNTTQRFSRNEAKQRHRKLSIHNQHIVYNCIFNVLCRIVSLLCNGVLYRLCLVLVKYALNEDFILAFDSCPFCVVIRFFPSPPQRPMTQSRLRRIKCTRSYPLHYFLILILEKEPVFPFSMLSAKQGNYWYHFYNVFSKKKEDISRD